MFRRYTFLRKCDKTKLVILIVIFFCIALTKISTAEDSENSNNDEKKGPKRNKVNCTRNAWGYKECKCPPNPITARYTDYTDKTCEYFYLCHLGKGVRRQCGGGEAFHPELEECLPRQRIPDNICKPIVECSLQRNRYVEDRRDCTKYYLCYYGRYSHWSCPEGNYFDPKGEKCVKDKQHAEACMIMAKRNFYKRSGYEDPPPKTSVALDKAKKYMEERKKKGNSRGG